MVLEMAGPVGGGEGLSLLFYLIILAIIVFFGVRFLRKAGQNAWITTGVILLVIGIGTLLAVSLQWNSQRDSERVFGLILGFVVAGPGLWILLKGFSRMRLSEQTSSTVPNPTPDTHPSQSKCEKCGYWNPSTAEFCSKCGSKLYNAEGSSAP